MTTKRKRKSEQVTDRYSDTDYQHDDDEYEEKRYSDSDYPMTELKQEEEIERYSDSDSPTSVDLTKRCTACGVSLGLTSFFKHRYSKDGLASECKLCIKKRQDHYRETGSNFWIRLVHTCHRHVALKRRVGRELECTITPSYMKGLFDQQRQLCYYSNIKMNPRSFSQWQVSPERLDNTIGYVPGNVVLICLELQTPSQWTQVKIKKLLDTTPATDEEDQTVIQAIKRARLPTARKNGPMSDPTPVIINNQEHILCGGCNSYKNIQEFLRKGSIRCFDCRNQTVKALQSTIRGRVCKLLNQAKWNTKARNRIRGTNLEMTLDLDTALDKLIEQKGRCHISNVLLTYGGYKNGDWAISLERRDVNKGYTPDNCYFVANEFNATDVSAGRDHAISTGWTKEKFDFLIATAQQKYS